MKKLFLLLSLFAPSMFGALTTISDTLYRADGTTCSGSLYITWQDFIAPDGHRVAGGSLTSPIILGVVLVSLEPASYAVQYQLAPPGCTPTSSSWVVPSSIVTLNIAAVETDFPPVPPAQVALTSLSQSGATNGEAVCWSSTIGYWVPGLCGGTGISSITSNCGISTNPNPITSTGTIESVGVCVPWANSSSGTTLYGVVKQVSGQVINTATTDTGGAIGCVQSGAGTTGIATVQMTGLIECNFDATTVVAGDYVVISSTTGGTAHDAGSTPPTSGQILGVVYHGGAGGNPYFVDTALGQASTTGAGGILITNLAGLPATCTVGAAGNLYWVTDATTSTGGLNLYACTSTNSYTQIGYSADGTGYLTMTCSVAGSCLVGPNTSIIPSKTGSNTFTGANNFSGATATYPMVVASSAPATCSVGQFYFNSTSTTTYSCTATNTWTAVGGTATNVQPFYKPLGKLGGTTFTPGTVGTSPTAGVYLMEPQAAAQQVAAVLGYSSTGSGAAAIAIYSVASTPALLASSVAIAANCGGCTANFALTYTFAANTPYYLVMACNAACTWEGEYDYTLFTAHATLIPIGTVTSAASFNNTSTTATVTWSSTSSSVTAAGSSLKPELTFTY